MSDRGRRLRLGVFMALCLLALAGLIVFFSGAPRLFEKRNEYIVLFNDAPGVSVGSPIRRSGVRVGEVGALDLDDKTGLVRLTLRIDPRFTPRTGEEITINRNLISSDSTIDFVPRDSDKLPIDLGDPIPVGSELIGVAPLNARSLITQTTDLLPDAKQSLDAIRRSVQRFEKIAPRIEETLESFADVGRSVNEFVPEVRRTNDELRELVAGTRRLEPDIRKSTDEFRAGLLNLSTLVEEVRTVLKVNEPEVMRAVRSVTNTVDRVGQVFNDANQAQISESLKSVNSAAKKIDTLSGTADETVREFQKVVPQIQQALTQVDMMIRDVRATIQPIAQRADRVAANIEASTEQFRGIVTDIREVIRAFARADGTVARLLNDPALFQNLNNVTVGITRWVPRVERILMDFEVFADKIARHPDLIGIGGAVRPSTGLKDVPLMPNRQK